MIATKLLIVDNCIKSIFSPYNKKTNWIRGKKLKIFSFCKNVGRHFTTLNIRMYNLQWTLVDNEFVDYYLNAEKIFYNFKHW